MPMPHPDPGRQEQDKTTITTLAKRAFTSLIRDLRQPIFGCIRAPEPGQPTGTSR